MLRTTLIALLCSLVFLGESRGQDVFVPRQQRKLPVIKPDVEPPSDVEAPKPQLAKEPGAVSHGPSTKSESATASATKKTAVSEQPEKARSPKIESVKGVAAKEPAENTHSE